MTHDLLLRTRRFTEGARQLVRHEEGIVTESMRPARLVDNPPRDCSAFDHGTRIIDKRRRTHVLCSPLRNAAQSRDEQSIVLVIQRLSGKIRAATPPFAADTRRAAKRVDTQPGVVGKGWAA